MSDNFNRTTARWGTQAVAIDEGLRAIGNGERAQGKVLQDGVFSAREGENSPGIHAPGEDARRSTAGSTRWLTSHCK